MATKTRFNRSLKGENAEVIVTKAIAYTAQGTIALFEANAAEGEVGIYNADTNVLITAAMATGTRYYTVIKRDGQAFRTAPVIYDATRTRRTGYIAPVKQVTTINIPASIIGYVLKEGDYLGLATIETTPGNEPYPTIDWDEEIGNPIGATVLAQITAIVARINNPLDLVQKDDGQQYSATIGTDGAGGQNIVITSFYFGQHFRVALRGVLQNGSVTYTTPFKLGVGDSDSVGRIENEGLVFAGVTTNYPGIANPDEFGVPTKFTVNSLTYVTYQLDPLRTSPSPAPYKIQHMYAHLYIIVPVAVGGDAPTRAASSPDLAVGTVLGFTLTP
jgi:hypothetical protein